MLPPNEVNISDKAEYKAVFDAMPRVRQLAIDIESQYAKLYSNPDSVFKTFNGRFFPGQVEEMLLYALEKLQDPDFCKHLEELDMNADLKLTKHPPKSAILSVSPQTFNAAGLLPQTLAVGTDIDRGFAPEDLVGDLSPFWAGSTSSFPSFPSPEDLFTTASTTSTSSTTATSNSSSTRSIDSPIEDRNLPRSLIFACRSDGTLFLGGLSLSKNARGEKPPVEKRIVERGTTKSLKAYVAMTGNPGELIAIDMARLHAELGPVSNNDPDLPFSVEIKTPSCSWRKTYFELLAEVQIAQRFDSPYLAKPRMGTPYKKQKENGSWYWVVNIHDERALSLHTLIYREYAPVNSPLYNNVNGTVQLTSQERAEVQTDLHKKEVPSLFRMLARSMLLGLMELHNGNIIHSDIKSSNMLVARQGDLCAKVTDFGSALDVAEATKDTRTLLTLLGYDSVEPNFMLDPLSIRNAIMHLMMTHIFKDVQDNMRGNREETIKNTSAEIARIIRIYLKRDPTDDLALSARVTNPTVEDVQNRITLIMRSDPDTTRIESRSYIINAVEPIATFPYAAPEVFKFQLTQKMATFRDYFIHYAKVYKDARQEPVALAIYNDSRIPEVSIPTKAQDVWSMGISLFELLFGHLPKYGMDKNGQWNADMQIVIYDPFFKRVLDPNPTTRCTIEEAYRLWEQWEIKNPHARTSAAHREIADRNKQDALEKEALSALERLRDLPLPSKDSDTTSRRDKRRKISKP